MDYFYRAYKVLDEVFRGGAYSNISLNKSGAISDKGDGADSGNALVTRIVYGVIERGIELDYKLTALCKTLPKPQIKVILKLSLYCLWYMDKIPQHAVLSNAQKLCDRLGKGALKGFVRGVLQSAIDGKAQLPDKDADYPLYLSVKYSVNHELVSLITEQYDGDCEKVLSAVSQNPDTREHIRVNLLKVTKQQFETELTEHGVEFEKSEAGGYFVSYPQLKNSAVDAGHYTVMGFSSKYIIDRIMADGAAEIFDACAAPGGKAVYLAEKVPGGRVTANELHPHRAKLIESYANRLGATNIEIICGDAAVLDRSLTGKFDIVLCDVPCSGLGIAHKKPEIKLTKTKTDVEQLSQLQYSILSNCSNYVKSGGRLYYSTCTIFYQENENIVEKFLSENSGFKRLHFDGKFSDNKGNIKFVNGINSAEGFFMCGMVKL